MRLFFFIDGLLKEAHSTWVVIEGSFNEGKQPFERYSFRVEGKTPPFTSLQWGIPHYPKWSAIWVLYRLRMVLR